MSEYKLVPVEPTEEMIAELWRELNRRANPHFDHESTRHVYRAMLAAAPVVSAEPVMYRYKMACSAYPDGVWVDELCADMTLLETQALYTHPPAPTVAWQPIETAPKDQDIWLWFPTMFSKGHMTVGRWDSDQYAQKPRPYWTGSARGRANEYRNNPPTHWQPLPTPPNGGV